jgi:hypothetical protein
MCVNHLKHSTFSVRVVSGGRTCHNQRVSGDDLSPCTSWQCCRVRASLFSKRAPCPHLRKPSSRTSRKSLEDPYFFFLLPAFFFKKNAGKTKASRHFFNFLPRCVRPSTYHVLRRQKQGRRRGQTYFCLALIDEAGRKPW